MHTTKRLSRREGVVALSQQLAHWSLASHAPAVLLARSVNAQRTLTSSASATSGEECVRMEATLASLACTQALARLIARHTTGSDVLCLLG
jgi:hypothetical protein